MMSPGYLSQFKYTLKIATKNVFTEVAETINRQLKNVNAVNSRFVVSAEIQENINRENEQLSCYKIHSSQYRLFMILSK